MATDWVSTFWCGTAGGSVDRIRLGHERLITELRARFLR